MSMVGNTLLHKGTMKFKKIEGPLGHGNVGPWCLAPYINPDKNCNLKFSSNISQ